MGGVCDLSTLLPQEGDLLIMQSTDTQSYISKQPWRSGLSGGQGILRMGKHSAKAMQLWRPCSVAAPQSQNIMSHFQNCETVLPF